MQQDEPLAQYSIEYFNKVLDSFISSYKEIYQPDPSPRAYILGGQPGAGKTTLHGIIQNLLSKNIIIINGDDFRGYHPNFYKLREKYGKDWVDYTNAFSGKMVESIISRLSQMRYNLIIEGTLRTISVPISTCRLLKQQGYYVELSMIVVKPEISYSSTILRYEKMISRGLTARATPKGKHDEIVHNLVENLDQIDKLHLFDNITLYNRAKQCLYDQSINSNQKPAGILNQVLFGFWSLEERDSLLKILRETQKLMERRTAPELSDFVVYCKNLIDSVEAAMSDSLENRLRLARCKSDKAPKKLSQQRTHEVER